MNKANFPQKPIPDAGYNESRPLKVTVEGISKTELKGCLELLKTTFNCTDITIRKSRGV